MTEVDVALQGLRARGQRVTPARRAVIEVLADTTAHLGAEEIITAVTHRAGGVHRATVYRALNTLTDLGVVAHTHLPHSATVYHLADGRGDAAHAHLQCSRCGRVIDIEVDLLDPLVRRLDADLGFTLTPEHAALLGTCRDCAGP